MRVFGLLFIAATASCSSLFIREDLDSAVGDGGLLTLDYKRSMGLICDTDNGRMIAKVGCGDSDSYKSVSADSLSMEDMPEFSMVLDCIGSEDKLSDCKHSEPQPLHKCYQFVACENSKRSMLRDVL